MPASRLRAVLVTNRYPTQANPQSGTYVPSLCDALERAGVSVRLVHLDRHERGRRTYAGAPALLRDAIARFDPDVVNVLWGGVGALVTVHTVRDRPVVVTLCGTDLLGIYLTWCEGPWQHAARFAAVAASRIAIRRAAHVIVVSRNLGARLRYPHTVVPRGVDTERFKPMDGPVCRRELGWLPDRKHILFPSSPNRSVKRFALARRTVELLQRQGHRVELHALAGVPHRDVPTWLNAAHAVLLTSRSEGAPNVVKEALACGLPVVSVPVGDVPELLAGVHGSRTAPATPAALAAAVAEVWTDHRRIPVGDFGDRHSWSRTAEATQRVFRDVVARWHPT